MRLKGEDMQQIGKAIDPQCTMSRTECSEKPKSEQDASTARELYAARCVKALMGFYPDRGNVDPDMYAKALRRQFSAYPESVCRKVIDPVHGLPSRLKWFPSLAEVSDALKAANAHNEWCEEHEARQRAIANECRQIEIHRKSEAERRAQAEEARRIARGFATDKPMEQT